MKLPVLVHGTIRLTSEKRQISVRFDGNVIRIDSPRLWDLRAWVQALRESRAGLFDGEVDHTKPTQSRPRPKAGSSMKTTLRAVDAWLRKADMTLELGIGGQVIARIGVEAKPTWTSRWLGLSPMEIEAGPMVWALFQW